MYFDADKQKIQDPPAVLATSDGTPEKPKLLQVIETNIDPAAKDRQHWVCYKIEWIPPKNGKPGRWTKVPYNPRTGYKASSTNKKTWSTFSQAMQAYLRGEYDGIGFMFEPGAGIVFIDLDHCRDAETGIIEPWAQEIIDHLSPCYIEVSPSGTGVHIFVYGTLPSDPERIKEDGTPAYGRRRGTDIEVYEGERYSTITGHIVDGNDTIADRSAELEQWYWKTFPPSQTKVAQSTPLPALSLNDDSILKKAFGAANGHETKSLYDGHLNGHPSASEAEMSLCCRFAFYTRDPEQIERLVGSSSLNRDKWEKRADYRKRTIRKALATVTTQYDPARRIVQMMNGAAPRAESTRVENNDAAQSIVSEFPPVRGGEQLPPLEREFILRCLDEEEDGDAKMFAWLYENRLIFDHAEKSWNEWKGHYWGRSKTGIERRLVTGQLAWQYLNLAATLTREAKAEADSEEATRKLKMADRLMTRARQLRKLNRIKNVLELAAGHLGTDGEQWDQTPNLLGVKNGVIDLTLRIFRPGRPDDFIRTVAPTEWKGFDEPAPRFEQFVLEIQDGARDVADFIRRAFGVGIWGGVIEHILIILWGSKGRNGKDTLLETISYVLGPMAGAIPANILLAAKREQSEGPTPFLYDLRGKRIVWASETNEGAQLNAGQVKYITGGGEITARLCRGNAVHFKPTHTPFMLTNEKPRAKSDDSALWSRLFLIPFNLRFIDDPKAENERLRDRTLPKKLEQESSGILAWLIRGYFEWQDGGLNPPDSVKLATKQYRESEDTITTFINECCDRSNDTAEVSASELYKSYYEFTGKGIAVNQKVFAQKFGEIFNKRTLHGRKFYIGITLLDTPKDSPKGEGGEGGEGGSSKPRENKSKVANNHKGESPASPISRQEDTLPDIAEPYTQKRNGRVKF